METVEIRYQFSFPDGRQKDFLIRLDATRLEPIDGEARDLPDWTRLDFHRCRHCPLDVAKHPRCPLAVQLVEPVAKLGDVISHDQVQVEVVTEERTVIQTITAQTGISAMMGLIIATSGCPHTAYFKPMARFHLPFANEDETLYRAASMYLLGQYFRQCDGGAPDLEFKGLLEIYRNMETVNRFTAQRLRAASRQDGTANAIVLLDMFAKTFPLALDDVLQDLRYLFEAYSPKP